MSELPGDRADNCDKDRGDRFCSPAKLLSELVPPYHEKNASNSEHGRFRSDCDDLDAFSEKHNEKFREVIAGSRKDSGTPMEDQREPLPN